MAYLTRQTYWTDERGEVVQIAFGWLDEAWDLQAEVVKAVGPFDTALEVMQEAHEQCSAQRDRQMAGQRSLLL